MIKQFELWLAYCQRNKTEVIGLEGDADNGLYETRRSYLGAGNNYWYEPVVYIGWSGDRIIVASEDYRMAYDTWKSRQGG